MDRGLTLRAFREEDLAFLDRLCADPAALGEFEWFGFRDVRTWRRRWEKDPAANSTGSGEAWRPSGSLRAQGVRPATTGDYSAWTPDQA